MPQISVIIPAYNNKQTIEKCLEAVRQSTYRDYELIVVDCGSRDSTPAIAVKYADKVMQLQGKPNRSRARSCGIKEASGQIIVNIDSDVVIKPDTLIKINNYFFQHQEVDALTGLLSKEHPNSSFFSQYKNLYMYYIFSKLPEKVNFLYGAIYAFRRQTAAIHDSDIKIADDTALGQKLVSGGKQIAFLKDLEVIHLKRYSALIFIKNDFQIPFEWAKIFLIYKGWKQLGRYGTGYAHAPKEQLISVLAAPALFLALLGSLGGYNFIPGIFVLGVAWFSLNLRFLLFLTKERGLIFGILALFVTLADNIVMASGILWGFVMFFVPVAHKSPQVSLF